MKIYKVVHVDKDGLESAILHNSWLNTQYKIGEYVSAPRHAIANGYYLTAFKTLKDAITFAQRSKYLRIYKAEGQEQISPLPPMCNLEKLMSRKEFLPGLYRYYFWPWNTVMFKKIKLLEEVKYKNRDR